jgi:hypothetical protein
VIASRKGQRQALEQRAGDGDDRGDQREDRDPGEERHLVWRPRGVPDWPGSVNQLSSPVIKRGAPADRVWLGALHPGGGD